LIAHDNAKRRLPATNTERRFRSSAGVFAGYCRSADAFNQMS
jgi:hypothetical protein